MKTIRFGIVGTGNICRTFCKALALTDNAEATAVCSRSLETARAFADEAGIDSVYDDVAAMAQDE